MRTYSFDGFELAAELTHRGRVVHLQPRQRAVLRCLLEHADRRVSVAELVRECWGGNRASRASVHTAIRAIRRAVDGVLIGGKQGVGYQIHADVKARGPVGKPEHWRYYAAHASGTDAQKVATADALMLAEVERYGP